MCVSLSVCVRVYVSALVCVRVPVSVSVCYNNGNIWEILRSAHPSGSKKDLRVTHFCYLQFLRVTHFCNFRLRFDCICTPVHKGFQS
jgi:hypothetical protein